MAKVSIKHLTPAQRTAMLEDLRIVLEDLGNGFYRYKTGASDMWMARKHVVSANQVRMLRLQFFGKLEVVTPAVKYPVLVKRVEELEARLATMEARAVAMARPLQNINEQRIPINGSATQR